MISQSLLQRNQACHHRPVIKLITSLIVIKDRMQKKKKKNNSEEFGLTLAKDSLTAEAEICRAQPVKFICHYQNRNSGKEESYEKSYTNLLQQDHQHKHSDHWHSFSEEPRG